jgi:hypothetical protein
VHLFAVGSSNLTYFGKYFNLGIRNFISGKGDESTLKFPSSVTLGSYSDIFSPKKSSLHYEEQKVP